MFDFLRGRRFRPLFSIVIPVFNGEKYVEEAILSAAHQTYQNTEIIVVNDGSNDGTGSIVQRLASKYPIRYFEQKNAGVSAALNTGVANMRGEYFAWLSHDDVFKRHKVSKQVAALAQLPDKKTIVYSMFDRMIGDGTPIPSTKWSALHSEQRLNRPLYPLLRGTLHGCCMMIHRSHFEKYGLFDTKLRCTQDYDLFFRILKSEQVKYIDEPLTRVRFHAERGTEINPIYVSEGNDLWKRILETIPDAHAVMISGSRNSFLRDQSEWLKHTPYQEAHRYGLRLLAPYSMFHDTTEFVSGMDF